jgi:hypothetical protein
VRSLPYLVYLHAVHLELTFVSIWSEAGEAQNLRTSRRGGGDQGQKGRAVRGSHWKPLLSWQLSRVRGREGVGSKSPSESVTQLREGTECRGTISAEWKQTEASPPFLCSEEL